MFFSLFSFCRMQTSKLSPEKGLRSSPDVDPFKNRMRAVANIRAQKQEKRYAGKTKSFAPLNVGLLSLSPDVDVTERLYEILASKDIRISVNQMPSGGQWDEAALIRKQCVLNRPVLTLNKAHNKRFLFIPIDRQNEIETLDICKVLDWLIVFVSVSAGTDAISDHLIQLLKIQSMPSVVGCICGVGGVKGKNKRAGDVSWGLTRFLRSLDVDCKVFTGVPPPNKLMMHLADATSTPVSWVQERPHMVVIGGQVSEGSDIVQLRGYVRGQHISPNNPVSVLGIGDFRVHSVVACQDPVMPLLLRERDPKEGQVKLVSAETSSRVPGDEMEKQNIMLHLLDVSKPLETIRRGMEGIIKVDRHAEGENPQPKGEEEDALYQGFKSGDILRLKSDGGDVEDDQDDEVMRQLKGEVDDEEAAEEEEEEEEEELSTYEEMGEGANTAKGRREEMEEAGDEFESSSSGYDELSDEVFYHIGGASEPVREIFKRYRSLASLRTSKWIDYRGQISDIPEYTKELWNVTDRDKVMKAQREVCEADNLFPGMYLGLNLIMAGDNKAELAAICSHVASSTAMVVVGLYEPEIKDTVNHFRVRLCPHLIERAAAATTIPTKRGEEEKVKGKEGKRKRKNKKETLNSKVLLRNKEDLTIMYGFRTVTAKPILSKSVNNIDACASGNGGGTLNRLKVLRELKVNVSKGEKPSTSDFYVLSAICPMSLSHAPVMVFSKGYAGVICGGTSSLVGREGEAGVDTAKDGVVGKMGEAKAAEAERRRGGEGEEDEIVSKHPFLVASGSMLSSSVGRQIIKRAVITGRPFKIRNRKVVVREMFGTSDDVRYFANVPLWASRGKRGVIVKAISDQGYFKARFNKRIHSGDSIAMRLYKRVFPGDRAAHELLWHLASRVGGAQGVQGGAGLQ